MGISKRLSEIWNSIFNFVGKIATIHWVFTACSMVSVVSLTGYIGWINKLNPAIIFAIIFCTLVAVFVFILEFIRFFGGNDGKGKNMIGPIIFIGFGVLFFGSGIILLFINQNSKINSINKDIESFPDISDKVINNYNFLNRINPNNPDDINIQFDLVEAIAKNIVLEKFLSKIEQGKEGLDLMANLLLEGLLKKDNVARDIDYGRALAQINRDIYSQSGIEIDSSFSEKDFVNKPPLPEEKNIADENEKWNYRYNYFRIQSDRKKLDEYIKSIRSKIAKNNNLISLYAEDKIKKEK